MSYDIVGVEACVHNVALACDRLLYTPLDDECDVWWADPQCLMASHEAEADAPIILEPPLCHTIHA